MSVTWDSPACQRPEKELRLHLPPPQSVSTGSLSERSNSGWTRRLPAASMLGTATSSVSDVETTPGSVSMSAQTRPNTSSDRATIFRPEQRALCDDTIVAGKANSCRIFSKSDDIGCGTTSSVNLMSPVAVVRRSRRRTLRPRGWRRPRYGQAARGSQTGVPYSKRPSGRG